MFPEKVWYDHYRGYIVKNWLVTVTDPTGKIITVIKQEKIPYNHPNNFLNFLDKYKYH